MKIYHEELSEITRYIARNRDMGIEQKEREFEEIFQRLRALRDIGENAQILEIGIGTGWFPLLCRLKGIACRGLEISPQLIEFACNLGARYGVEPDIVLGNVEEEDIGRELYDVVIACSVFEHVEHWRDAIKKVYDALKPGGILLFISTNRFSLRQGEYNFPFYGWLPDTWRYRLRIAAQGPDVMKLGIDYNQFTHPQLRKCFTSLGFTQVLDDFDLHSRSGVEPSGAFRRLAMRLCRGPLKHLALTFRGTTSFTCVK